MFSGTCKLFRGRNLCSARGWHSRALRKYRLTSLLTKEGVTTAGGQWPLRTGLADTPLILCEHFFWKAAVISSSDEEVWGGDLPPSVQNPLLSHVLLCSQANWLGASVLPTGFHLEQATPSRCRDRGAEYGDSWISPCFCKTTLFLSTCTV